MSRTQEQNTQMREARKEKIIQEALKQFAMKGLSATRIQDIAKGAGMAQGLLYHYYPSKEAIYIDLIDDALDSLNQATRFMREMDKPVQEKILLALRELFKTIQTSDRFRQTCRLIAQATNSMEIPEEAYKLLQQKRNVPYQIMAEIMRQGQQEGSVVDGHPDALAILFWTSVNGLAIYYATRPEMEFNVDFRLLAATFLKDRNFIEVAD
jgi:TetR/AcrR family transcriptional regulator